MILAVDTTHEFGSLALIDHGAVVAESLIHAPEGFGSVLFDRLQRLLAEADCELGRIDCYAAAAGPGSFTGVRIGLACVKGLADAMGKPAAGVSNLQAIASFGTAPVRAAVLDARRGEIYGGVYDAALRSVQPEVVMPFPDWLATLPAEVEICAIDALPFRAAAPEGHWTQVPRALAAAVGRVAESRWKAGEPLDPALLDANYVRRSDAELLWKDR